MAVSLCYLTFSCIIFLVSQQMVTGLKCYVCYDCAKPNNLITVGSGEAGYACTKGTMMVGGKINHVTRGSSSSSSCYEYNLISDGTGYSQNCCTSDACNGGIVFSNSFSLLLVLLIICGIFKSFNTN